MMDIKKPEFMQAAASQSRSHGVIFEIVIAIALVIAGSFVAAVIQMPASFVYLFNNTDYVNMVLSNDIDYDSLLSVMEDMPDWMTVVSLLSEAGLMLVVILYCRFAEKRKLFTMGFRKKKLVKQYLFGVLVGSIAFVAAYLLCLVSTGLKLQTAQNIPVFALIGFFLGYMMQSLAEEVMCRGYLLVSLSRRYSMITSVIISAVFFAFLHGMNQGITVLAYINLFLFGVFLALVFIRYENIWIVAGLHFIWNFLEGNVFGIQVSGAALQPSFFVSTLNEKLSVINGGSFGLEGGVAVTVVLGLALLWTYRTLVKNDFVVRREWSQNAQRTDEYAKNPDAKNGKNWEGFSRSDRFGDNRDNGGNAAGTRPQNGPNASNPSSGPNIYGQGNQAGSNPYGQSHLNGQETTAKNQQTGHENMGLNPEETPWHPGQKEQPEEKKTPDNAGAMTGFDQSYFKD